MNNSDVYLKNPATRKLVNEGVANVNDDRTDQALAVLRYELETFVCDGEYRKGMIRILETYLKNIDQAQQPGVWVSGFFGSGKSHFVKMLRALWDDTVFPDGATARGTARLPQEIKDALRELDVQAKRHGGLRAASGTLGAGAEGSARLALLGIVFKSLGLPEQYPVARFLMWLKQEGIDEDVRSRVEQNGLNWGEELDNFYVAEGLHEALAQTRPNLFTTSAACVETLNNLYPYREDVSSDEMLKAMRQALSRDGKFPLTLIVLDEVQQYIGGDGRRANEVQELVEACCKNMGGRLLFIGTGQTAVTGTSNLRKLEGRFTVRVELSDADVDAVIRQVILAKKPEAAGPIEQVMQANLGEISRHLAGTALGHRQEDAPFFAQDYPILPVRRRFWEHALRALDQTGTDSQLRNQLGMVHKAIQTNPDAPLGYVVPADFLYFDAADKLLQGRLLPRRLHQQTMTWRDGGPKEQLLARACGLVFLINKLGDRNPEIGIRATTDTLADLLVEDLAGGSGALRAELPGLLASCDLLMRVGDEYRIQTEESTAWNDEFQSLRSALASEAHRIESERDDRIRKKFGELAGRLSLTQGAAKVVREPALEFTAQPPADSDRRVCVWVRDGWSADEDSVRADARQAGDNSPTVFVFIPKRSADDLRGRLIDAKAARATLDRRGAPNTPEGEEARAAMETTLRAAEAGIDELLGEAFSGAQVLQGGGAPVVGADLRDMLLEAAGNSLARLYPKFDMADHPGWAKVYERAKAGAPDALKAVGDPGETADNPVCKAVLAALGGGIRGADLRARFEAAPYGWSRDAVDGAVQCLLLTGLARAQGENGRTIEPRELERKAIGRTLFRVEAATVSAAQRIQIRKLLQKAGLAAKQGEEANHVPQFLRIMADLADRAGGEAPGPPRPDTASLDEIRLASGNEQLLALYERREELGGCFDAWTDAARRIAERLPGWQVLQRLAAHASGLSDAEALVTQARTVEQERQLLAEPDPVEPLLSGLAQTLREELNRLDDEYAARHKAGIRRLEEDVNWRRLKPDQRHALMSEQHLHEAARPKVSVQSPQDVLDTLDRCGLAHFAAQVAALPGRFDEVLKGAAALCEPQVQFVHVPGRTLRDEKELEAWLDEVRQTFKERLKNGPVRVQ